MSINYCQIIYFGAPGTGKSHYVSQLLEGTEDNQIFRTTIHPEYSYSDFVGQILPIQKEETVEFDFKPGVFTRALKKAFKDRSKNVYLILEEVSRGNVSAILGDIFQLLDRDKYFESKYPIRNLEVSNEILELEDDQIYLPSNFNIIGTVNVNDQSVFPMDTAFKRRFEWEYISTKPVVDSNTNYELNNPIIKIINENRQKIETTWVEFYTSLNEFITDKVKGMSKNEDKQIGQFFIKFSEETIEESRNDNDIVNKKASEKIDKLIKNKLLLYLWQDIEGNSVFDTGNTLFKSEINSYEELYFNYESKQVFSDIFLNEFLFKQS